MLAAASAPVPMVAALAFFGRGSVARCFLIGIASLRELDQSPVIEAELV